MEVTRADLQRLEDRINELTSNGGMVRNSYCNMRMDALERLMCVKVNEIEEKTSLAREAMEHRLDGMNEFRASLRDQAGHFMGKSECRLIHQKAEAERDVNREAIKDLQILAAQVAGKASSEEVLKARTDAMRARWIAIAGVSVAFLGTTIGIILTLVLH